MLYRGRVLIVELAVLIQEKTTTKQLFWEHIPLGATGGAVFTEKGGWEGGVWRIVVSCIFREVS